MKTAYEDIDLDKDEESPCVPSSITDNSTGPELDHLLNQDSKRNPQKAKHHSNESVGSWLSKNEEQALEEDDQQVPLRSRRNRKYAATSNITSNNKNTDDQNDQEDDNIAELEKTYSLSFSYLPSIQLPSCSRSLLSLFSLSFFHCALTVFSLATLLEML